MQSSLVQMLLFCTLAAAVLAQQFTSDDMDKRAMSSFAKRSYRQFAFAKRAAEEEEIDTEKRARFAFAKRSLYRTFAFAKRASPYGFAFAKRGMSSFA